MNEYLEFDKMASQQIFQGLKGLVNKGDLGKRVLGLKVKVHFRGGMLYQDTTGEASEDE